ncbi:hypothetical protein IPL68_07745 [Candidatus Saccharibacteria bacterium]|nr:MAG: hypothetical protein IPL68_07745 [Candidatus Saccharibacteria bacterium]
MVEHLKHVAPMLLCFALGSCATGGTHSEIPQKETLYTSRVKCLGLLFEVTYASFIFSGQTVVSAKISNPDELPDLALGIQDTTGETIRLMDADEKKSFNSDKLPPNGWVIISQDGTVKATCPTATLR